MKVRKNQNNNITFKGRCVQIRDAQWVCHVVNTERPHFSTTKFTPIIIKQLNKIERHFPFIEKSTINQNNLYKIVEKLGLDKNDKTKFGLFQKIKIQFANKFIFNEEDKHLLKILKKAKENADNFWEKRKKCVFYEDKTRNAITLMERHKLGNCNETARLAELILKMNGVKNATTVFLKAKNQNCTLDHAVCVFNKDGSKFSSINRNTIVVDPWADKADFAYNMLKYYKNQCSHLFHMPEKQKLTFFVHDHSNIYDNEIKRLRKQYPEFVFKNAKRNFMET